MYVVNYSRHLHITTSDSFDLSHIFIFIFYVDNCTCIYILQSIPIIVLIHVANVSSGFCSRV